MTVTSEYQFARPSAIPNAGEDFQNSARHRRNEWRSLAEAEADGSAAELVTRDQLLKNEPPNFLEKLNETNAKGYLAAYTILRAFPPQPYSEKDDAWYRKRAGQHKQFQPQSPEPKSAAELRQQYYDLYRDFCDYLDQRVYRRGNEMFSILDDARQWIDQRMVNICNEHSVERSNPVLLGLNRFHGRLRRKRKPVKTDVASKLMELENSLQSAKTGESVVAYAKEILAGGSPTQTVPSGKEKLLKFQDRDQYAITVERRGGKAFLTYDLELLTDHFGFRGVQWGNAVPDKERAFHLKAIGEAFADLADVLQLPDTQMPLNGMGLAVGARGKSSAWAHYEPDEHLINLTRSKGTGMLSHEWGHAFDFTLADRRIEGNKALFLSQIAYWSTAKLEERGIDPRLAAAMNEIDRVQRSCGYFARLRETLIEMLMKKYLSEAKCSYFLKSEERFARCFERYVQVKLQERGRWNSYLSGVNYHPLWPNAEEMRQIAPAIEGLFNVYRNTINQES